MSTISTTWRHVRPGAVVTVRGHDWRVIGRDPWVLESATHGRREGAPPNLDAPVMTHEPKGDPRISLPMAIELIARTLGGRTIG